jgi:hypothetical protein
MNEELWINAGKLTLFFGAFHASFDQVFLAL